MVARHFTPSYAAAAEPARSRDELNASYRGLLDLLLDLDPRVTVEPASSAWCDQGLPFEASYFEALSGYFDAVARVLDLRAPGAKDTINAWVKQETHGFIDSIVEQIRQNDRLFLINALYFKGTWTTQFKKSETQPTAFRLPNGLSAEVQMMTGDIPDAGFAWTSGGRVPAELPYGGQAYGMVLMLPAEGETVDDLVADLEPAHWAGWMSSLSPEEVSGSLPRFELEWGDSLNAAVTAPHLKRGASSRSARHEVFPVHWLVPSA